MSFRILQFLLFNTLCLVLNLLHVQSVAVQTRDTRLNQLIRGLAHSNLFVETLMIFLEAVELTLVLHYLFHAGKLVLAKHFDAHLFPRHEILLILVDPHGDVLGCLLDRCAQILRDLIKLEQASAEASSATALVRDG